MKNTRITSLFLFVVCVSLFTVAYSKTKDGDTYTSDPDTGIYHNQTDHYGPTPKDEYETTNSEPIYWVDEDEYKFRVQPHDVNFCVNGVAVMSFTCDSNAQLTGIKILSQDTGYYSEDGITWYLCINGIKVEGSEFCAD